MLRLYVAAGAALISISLAGYGGYYTGTSLKQGEWDASVLQRKAGEDAALKAAAEAIAKIEVKSEKHIYPVRTEIRTNTVYRECKHSPDVLRNLNALIEGVESSGSAGVPTAKPAP